MRKLSFFKLFKASLLIDNETIIEAKSPDSQALLSYATPTAS